jgi:methylamine dehydrogenase heavy chain
MGEQAMRSTLRSVAVAALLGGVANAAEPPPLESETISVERLEAPGAHWIVVNDYNFSGYMDSKVYLFDADSGTMLGMLSTGGYRNAVEIAPDFSAIYSPETYYPRGTRGERTDVLTFYDTRSLEVIGEAVIPAKRATGMPHRAYNGMSDDGRFVYVANMTPATSVSVVDTKTKSFAEEIQTPGCALVYPTGPRSFASLCGDGTVLAVQLDANGHTEGRTRSVAFFDPVADPVTEKASRSGKTWYFISFAGWVHPVEFSDATPKPAEKWPLFSEAERTDGWKVGGMQFNGIDANTGTLYVIVHQGGPDTHKDPGKEVWVYDLASHKRSRTIVLSAPASNMMLSRDTVTLLYTTEAAAPAIEVYDALAGKHLRTIAGPLSTPSFVQVP